MGAPVEAARIRFVEVSTAPRLLRLCYPRMRFLLKYEIFFSYEHIYAFSRYTMYIFFFTKVTIIKS